MIQDLGRSCRRLLFSLAVIGSTCVSATEPIEDLARITQNLATQAKTIQVGDPISDLIQAIITIANVLNTSAPKINQFIDAADGFFPQAEIFVGDFHQTVNHYGQSWLDFTQSFSQVASIVSEHAPETIPKLNAALDSIKNITQLIEQNSDPFMTSIGNASSALTTLSSPAFITGAIAGGIAMAWCLKYEDLGKYVFTWDPGRNIFLRTALTCGNWIKSGWTSCGRGYPKRYRTDTAVSADLETDLEPDLEAGLCENH